MSKHLCYGTYAQVLLECSIENQRVLHEKLMLCMVGEGHALMDAGRGSKLFRCSESIPAYVRRELKNPDTAKVEKIKDLFVRHVYPVMNDSMLNSAVAAIWVLIRKDTKITKDVVIDRISNIKKDEMSQIHSINAFDFLAGTLIYAFIDTDNKIGGFFDKEILSAFIQSAFDEFEKSGPDITHESVGRKSPSKEESPKHDNVEMTSIILDSSKSKSNEYATSRGIEIDDNLLPQIISDNPAHSDNEPTYLDTVMDKNPNISFLLLYGEGGCGKTYLLYERHASLLRGEGVIPIYVPMGQLERTGKSPILHYVFDHYLAKTAWAREIDPLKQKLAAYFESTKVNVVFLLDAYNEYAYSAEASAVLIVEDEMRWLQGFSNVRIIVTSRSAKGFDHADVYRVMKLDKKSVDGYLKAHKQTQSIDIWDSSHEKVLELLRLPIMLTMFTKTYLPTETVGADIEIHRINKHSDILERCISQQIGNLRSHQSAPYVLKVLLPLLSDEMNRLNKMRMKRREIGESAYSAVQHTLSNEYSDLWWDYDIDKSNIENSSTDAMTAYRNLIDSLLIKNGLLLFENEGTISWQHELLLNWFMAKCIVLQLKYERKNALDRMREISDLIESSSNESDALFPVALYLYEMLEDDTDENASEEYILLLMAIARTYRDWRDSTNTHKFARLVLDKLKAIPRDVPGWRIARIKCLTAYTLLSLDSEDYANEAKEHFDEALALSRLDISPGDDEHAAKMVEATVYNNIGAFYLAINRHSPNETNLKKALENHKRSLDVRTEAFGNDVDSPEAAPYIGTSFHCIATDHFELGEYDKSIKNHRRAIDHREKGNVKEIRLVESYVRAIGVLLKLAELSGAENVSYLDEAVSLFQKALQHTDCFRRNRYEFSNLARHCKTLSDIICMPTIKVDDNMKLTITEIAGQIENLEV